MEKIKNILRPGHQKDDETMYGENAGRSASTTGTTETHTGRAIGSGSQADSTGFHEPEKKEHGILRQLLNPAGDKYDEQAYGTSTGTPSAALESSTAAGGSGRKASVVDLDNVDQLRTDPVAMKNEHGVLRQILNPHGAKYDDHAFGTTATEVGSDGLPEHSGKGPGELFTEPEVEQKERGVLRQILNPGGEKYDETRYGTTAVANAPLAGATTGTQGDIVPPLPSKIESTEAAEDDHGVLRQIINPGGDRHDDMRYGETGTAAPGTTPLDSKEQDSASAMSVKSGRLGLYASNTDSNTVGFEQASSTDTSHLGRDAALGGAAAAGVGAAGYEADKHHTGGTTATGSSTYPSTETGTLSSGSALPDRTAQSSTTAGSAGTGAVGSTYTARSFPVGGSSTTDSTSTPYHAGDELASSGMTAPLAGSTMAGDATGSSHLGRDAAMGTGAGVAGVTGLEAYERSLEPKQDVSDATYTYSSQQVGGGVGGHHDNETPDAGYVHHTQGPHSTETANRLDPHVPGEFPTETGEDRHKLGNREAAIIGGTGVGMAGIGAAGYEAGKSHEQPAQSEFNQSSAPSTTTGAPATTQSTLPSQTAEQQHHYGRDAALVGGAGAGAAGLGAVGYEASRLGNESTVASAAQPSTTTSQPLGKSTVGTSQPIGGPTSAYDDSASSAAPFGSATTSQPQASEHHYGRDAAVAGSAGAVGAGAYEATQDRGVTGPASKTVGPHDSNIANIVDPRVQPQPEKMKDHTTAGPYHSDTLNKVDPRVQSNPYNTEHQRDDTHHGRDAAVAAGAGAAGAGAYETTEQPMHNDSSSPTAHNHNKLHKKDDPRGPTGASNVIQDRHEHRLQEAREAEAAKHHEHGDREKKPSLIQRILHPGQHKHEQDSTESNTTMSPQDTDTPTSRTHIGNDAYQTPGARGIDETARDGVVNEPHTGLPMNVGKYGSGQGGTDAAENIGGYQEHASGAGSADWDKIKKANTPY